MTSKIGLAVLMLLSATVAMPAFAQSDDDAPIPYDDGSGDDEKVKPKKSKKNRERIREEDEEEKEGEDTLAHVDDPNIGVGGTFFAGVNLLESSRGGGVDPKFVYGVRFTWEWGRLIPDEFLREMFFADVQWCYSAAHDGTNQIFADANYHTFTLAPAVAIPFGKSFMSAYADVGIGFNYTYSALHIDKAETNLGSTKFVLQYGLGLRGRPAIVEDQSIRIEFRVELTRLVRGYMQDTVIAASAGMIF